MEAIATRAITLPQLPPNITPAASAKGLVELASVSVGITPITAIVPMM